MRNQRGGDTVEDLAKLIRFDNKDYRKWLKPVGPSRMPGSATEPITGCAEFTIPNTVFVDIGPRIRDPWYLRYVDKINATFTFLSAMARGTGDLYESKGFNVVPTEQATGTDIRIIWVRRTFMPTFLLVMVATARSTAQKTMLSSQADTRSMASSIWDCWLVAAPWTTRGKE